MIKEAIGTGASVEEALEAAKAALNAPEDADVLTEVLELPKKKTLGIFGGAPAKARAYYEAPDEIKETKVEAPAPKQEIKKEEKKPAPIKAEQPKAVNVSNSDMGNVAKNYVCSILKGMGVEDINVNVTEDEESINIDLDCGNGYGYIIGRRGETLDAIQYLTRLVINKGKDDYRRVSINAGNYREKREDTLRELAKKQAARVKKYGRNAVLDPMNPYERRIIHTTVQEIEGVSSHSVGSEADRKVVITLAEGFKATNPSKGRNGRNDYRRKNNYSQNPESKPTRAPRSDIGGSLYGKIEPKKPQE